MNHTQLLELMHAVLDGEATPAEARELEARLASDTSARAEFESLKTLFDGLSRVPQGFPPEGLVASVMGALPSGDDRLGQSDQLFSPSGVFEPNLKKARGRGSAPGKKARRAFQPWAFLWGEDMSEQKRGISKQGRIMIGGGIAAAAIVAVAVSTSVYPPSSNETAGTIVPAQRYRAAQPQDIQVGVPSGADSAQVVAGPGPAGQASQQGPKAEEGLRGLRGEEGLRGQRGEEGLRGLRGEEGLRGQRGEEGLRGQRGEEGLRGQRGEEGLRGQRGEEGLRGLRGEEGLRGLRGEEGLRGLRGEEGALQGAVAK